MAKKSPAPQPKVAATTKSRWFYLCVFIIFAIALFFILNFRFFITSGPSMEPTYTEGTFIISFRLHGQPKVDDVVMLYWNNKVCMKRVAFVAGEDVSAAGYEGYWGSSIIPEGYVYVLGDNPEHSNDSRNPDFGLVAIENIWGKPLAQREKRN